MRLRYTPEAISDIRSIKAYIRDQLHNPRAAARIGTMILDHCAALKTFPELGVSVEGKTGWTCGCWSVKATRPSTARTGM